MHKAPKRLSGLVFKAGGKKTLLGEDEPNSEEEDERKRVIEALFATPMRRFSHQHHNAVTAKQRIGGGTLRVRILSAHSVRLKQNTTMSSHLNKILLPLNEFKRKASSDGTPSPLAQEQRKLPKKEVEKHYSVDVSLGSAKGSTAFKSATNRRGDVIFDEDAPFIRLFVPDDNVAMLEAALKDALLNDGQATPALAAASAMPRRRVLHLKVAVSPTPKQPLDLETAIDLDRMLTLLDEVPVFVPLPLISRADPEELDLGHVHLELSFERRMLPKTNSFAAQLSVARSVKSMKLPQSEEEFESLTATTAELRMVPSAAALLAAVCTVAAVKKDHNDKQKSHSFGGRDGTRWPSPARRRFSCPDSGKEDNAFNREQLEGLREGWRMWRMADKTQYAPSHRAQDAALVGERFLNREAASSFFEPPPPALSLFSPFSPVKMSLKDSWCRGRTVLLTGGTSGIGREVGRALCQRQVRRLVLLCRDFNSGRNQAREWTHWFKDIEVDVIQCDLASMSETLRAVDQVRGLLEDVRETLDAAVLCAATIGSSGARHEFEETFAVNYMANFLIVHSLLSTFNPVEARIILAGCANALQTNTTFDLDDLQSERKGRGNLGLGHYMATKAMLSCFASELAVKLAQPHHEIQHVQCNVFYPGAVKSKLADKVLFHLNPTLARLADAAYGLTEGILIRTPQQGASLAVHLLSSSQVENGKVFHSGLTGQVADFSPHDAFGVAVDRKKCARLWAVSGKMLDTALGKDSRVKEWWELLSPERPA